MAGAEAVVALRDVRKDYQGLRPLRVEEFELRQGDIVSLLGLDRAAAEVFVNLVTAAMLPDAGDVRAFGVPTREVTNPDAWLSLLDRFGILSERVVLLGELSVEQNLALPLSLDLDNLAADVRRTVARLAGECGISPDVMSARVSEAPAPVRARIRLAKALALDPQVLLAEHPNALIPREDIAAYGSLMSSIAASRQMAMLVLTADSTFAAAVAGTHVMTLAPATGRITSASRWRGWLARR